MRRRISVPLYFGLIGMASGIIMANLDTIPRIIAVVVISISSALIAVAIGARGGFAIRDEMVVRVESLSGNYTTIATLYFIFLLSIVNFFRPLPLSVDGLLLIMMLFISLTYLTFRYVLMRRGKAE